MIFSENRYALFRIMLWSTTASYYLQAVCAAALRSHTAGCGQQAGFELQRVRALLSGMQDEVRGAHGRHAGQVDLHVLVAIGNRFRIIARVRVDDGVVSNNDDVDRVG